jgi:hypothetical protein
VFTSTMIGAMLTAAGHWHSHSYRTPIADELDQALGYRRAGL